MSTTEIAPGIVIPDKVTPEVGWRVWRAGNEKTGLMPVHTGSQPWKAGEPYVARCYASVTTPRAWIPTTIEEALETGETTHREFFGRPSVRREIVKRPPKVRLPRDMVYVWRETPVPHDPPEASCKCGIYATSDAERCADQLVNGSVLGTTALWGKVVAGDHGYRAQFGYPTRLFVVSGERFSVRSYAMLLTWPSMFGNTADEALGEAQAHILARRLSEAYGVPAEAISDWRDVL